MSLEQALAANTAAIQALTAALQAQGAPQASVPAPAAPTFVPQQTTPDPVPAAPPAAAPAMPAAPSWAPAAAPAAPAVPFTDAKGLIDYAMGVYKQVGPEKGAQIQQIAAHLGHQNVNDVRPDQYAQFYTMVETLKNG